ncbi:MAG: phage tail family protein [Oscillospiraceae bacterium]|nr:phage tail family protein [Oscillospiraceae bacterium]
MLENLICKAQKSSVDLVHDKRFVLKDIQGLSPETVINTVETVGADGSLFRSARSAERNILIVVGINQEYGEAAKIALYDVFRAREEGTLYYKSENRDVKIRYRAEKPNIPPMVYPMSAQISLICPDYFFESSEIKALTMVGILPNFEFPLELHDPGRLEFGTVLQNKIIAINNGGDVIIGVVFEITAIHTVRNPIFKKLRTDEYMQLNIEMQAGDVLRISTLKREQSITLKRGRESLNMLGSITAGSTFFQLERGENLVFFDAETGFESLTLICFYSEKFEGV